MFTVQMINLIQFELPATLFHIFKAQEYFMFSHHFTHSVCTSTDNRRYVNQFDSILDKQIIFIIRYF